MKAETRARSNASPARAGEAPRTCLWLKNEAGRKGIPALRSFERWLAAIPDLRKRRRWSEVNVLVVGTAAGRRYNREFRGRDYATNVLSFPYKAMPGEHSGLLGDLVICAPVVAREAREQHKETRDHFAHMTIHGVLHLLGYGHEDDAEAERMEGLETRILASLGIADPYSDQGA
jgi:probable rRNA maturation factor